MSVIKFIEAKKAEMVYNKICKKMKKLNVEFKKENGTIFIESEFNSLKYTFNDEKKEHKLMLNNQILFHKESPQNETVIHEMNIEKAKNIATSLDAHLGYYEARSYKETLSMYNDHEQKLGNMNSGKRTEVKDGDYLIEKNDFGRISHEKRTYFGDNPDLIDTTIKIRKNDDVVFEQKTTQKGDEVVTLSTNNLYYVSECVKNNLRHIQRNKIKLT